MTDGAIRVGRVDGIVTITIDRPERRNALSRALWLRLREALEGLRTDPGTRGVLLTGAGDRVFAAGADVAELVERPPAESLDGVVAGILTELEDLPFPTVAAINGHALGGGWELALACDLRVAVPAAEVGFPEVGLGIMPGAGGIARLLQHVGIGTAKRWVLTGRRFSAAEAASQGLIDRVVEPAALMNEARAVLNEMATQPGLAFRVAKATINATARGRATAELERMAYALTFFGPERTERMQRFLDGADDDRATPDSSDPS